MFTSAVPITAVSASMLEALGLAERIVGAAPQAEITTQHTLHAGMYARTMKLPAGHILVGALVQVETIVIFDGDADVLVGDSTIRLTGNHVIAASAMRKQIYQAHSDCYITAIFATAAKTVSEAEEQATKEHARLASGRVGNKNFTLQTGEQACLSQQQ